MHSYVLPPPAVPSLPVRGLSERFPVHRIYCVARNYAAHAREMAADPAREPPFFFSKPADALVAGGGEVPYPIASHDVHHELELVVALHGGGTHVRSEDALSLVYGYGVGLDLTRRDLQAVAKEHGRPWDTAKGFDCSAPVSELARAAVIGHPASGTIELRIDGAVRQRGDLSEMIWSVPEILAHLSTLYRLAPGDLVFTGTPSGVGPIAVGDRLHGTIDVVGELQVTIAPPQP